MNTGLEVWRRRGSTCQIPSSAQGLYELVFPLKGNSFRNRKCDLGHQKPEAES